MRPPGCRGCTGPGGSALNSAGSGEGRGFPAPTFLCSCKEKSPPERWKRNTFRGFSAVPKNQTGGFPESAGRKCSATAGCGGASAIRQLSAASRESAAVFVVEGRKACPSTPARYAHTRAVAESNETERPLNHPGWAQRSGGRLSPSTTAVARSVSGTRGAKTQGPFNFAARRPPKSPTCGGAVPNLHNVQRTRQKASGLSWN